METDDGSGKPEFVSQADNLADLAARIAPEDRAQYDSFGYTWSEAAFFNRRFLIVRTKGKASGGAPRPPEILGAVRVLGFWAHHEKGAEITVMDEGSSRTLQFGYVPVRLFRFPIFISVPVFMGMKWEAKEYPDGAYRRSMVFGICFKQQSNIKFQNRDNVSVVTPNDYRRTFGDMPPRY